MPHIWGVRTTWRTVGDGEFFCLGCGGDRSYLRRIGRHRFALLGIPLLPRGTAGTVVECAACRTCFRTDVLGHPTTTRFSAMLRDAVHTVALAVLAAGKEGIDGSGTALTLELHEVLDPLAPHLAPAGSEDILLQGARIALADGPYTPSEHQTLAAVGRALLLSHEDTERLLAIAARTSS